jgi:GntR family transcriptional repressor for pyruvate dehydrogenase complex
MYKVFYDEVKRMTYKRVATPRLAEQVKSQLKQSIFEGQYSPGQRMPSEYEMVEMFGVSRVIVREAVRDLERSGFVEIKRGPRGGAYVKRIEHDALTEIVRDIMSMGHGCVSDIMEVRLQVEPIVAALAAERATGKDIEMLEQYMEEEPEMPGEEYALWNVKFHRLVAKCSHNKMYEILINILMDFTQDLVLRIKSREIVIQDRVSHPEILKLIKKGDALGTEQRFRKHLEDIVPILKKLEDSLSL